MAEPKGKSKWQKGIKFKLNVIQVRASTFLCLHIGCWDFCCFTRQYYIYISFSRKDDDDELFLRNG